MSDGKRKRNCVAPRRRPAHETANAIGRARLFDQLQELTCEARRLADSANVAELPAAIQRLRAIERQLQASGDARIPGLQATFAQTQSLLLVHRAALEADLGADQVARGLRALQEARAELVAIQMAPITHEQVTAAVRRVFAGLVHPVGPIAAWPGWRAAERAIDLDALSTGFIQ